MPGGVKLVCEADKINVVARTPNITILSLFTDALHNLIQGRAQLNLILPYLPYSRADRRFVTGDCFGLKVFGNFINSLGYDKIYTLDCHSSIAKKCISNLIDVNPKPFIQHVLDTLSAETAILLPDEGAARYGWEVDNKKVFQCEKQRDLKTGKLSGFKVPDLNDFKSILIVDDICDGGGTFIGIAKEISPLLQNLYLYTTHGIYSRGIADLSVYFKHLYSSDSFNTLGGEDFMKIATRFPCLSLLLNE